MAAVWSSKTVDHENHFGKPLQLANCFEWSLWGQRVCAKVGAPGEDISFFLGDLEIQSPSRTSPDMDGLLMIYIIT